MAIARHPGWLVTMDVIEERVLPEMDASLQRRIEARDRWSGANGLEGVALNMGHAGTLWEEKGLLLVSVGGQWLTFVPAKGGGRAGGCRGASSKKREGGGGG